MKEYFEMIDDGGSLAYHLMFLMIANFLIAEDLSSNEIQYYYPYKDCKLENELLALLPSNFERVYTKEPGVQYRTFLHAIPVFEDSSWPQSYHLLRWLYREHCAPSIVPGKRLYIIRDPSTLKRTFLNEETVTATMQSLGFECIRMEEHSVKEQIRMFSEAETIVAAHGSALAFTVFCNPGVKIVEIFKAITKPKRHYVHLAETLGFQFQRFSEVVVVDHDENMIVNADKLRALLS